MTNDFEWWLITFIIILPNCVTQMYINWFNLNSTAPFTLPLVPDCSVYVLFLASVHRGIALDII